MKWTDYFELLGMYNAEAEKSGMVSEVFDRGYVTISRKSEPGLIYRLYRDKDAVMMCKRFRNFNGNYEYKFLKFIKHDRMPDYDDYYIIDNNPYTAMVAVDSMTAMDMIAHLSANISLDEIHDKAENAYNANAVEGYYAFLNEPSSTKIDFHYPDLTEQSIMTMKAVCDINRARRHYGEREYNLINITNTKAEHILFVKNNAYEWYPKSAIVEYREKSRNQLVKMINATVPGVRFRVFNIKFPYKQAIPKPFNVRARRKGYNNT